MVGSSTNKQTPMSQKKRNATRSVNHSEDDDDKLNIAPPRNDDDTESSDDDGARKYFSTDSDSQDEEWQYDSSSADDDEESEISDVGEDEESREIDEAMLEYMGALDEKRVKQQLSDEKAPGNEKEETEEAIDEPENKVSAPESDSSDDEMPSRNTIGDVPLKWYKDEEHIGYDVSGRKIKKKERKDKLDAFLARTDDAKDWRKIYDEYNDEEIELTKDEIDLIRRLRDGKIPHAEVDPYEPYVDWFDWEDKGHPLSSAPEPKRRFIPSKWEAKKVVKLVRAIRKGWIKLDKPKEKPKYYLMWGDDLKTTEKTANGLTYIPAPKSKLPGHEESYNPPIEYIPTQEEINSYQLMYEEDRPKFIPKGFESLRQVPAYSEFIKERFERCLDLYLCPRTRKNRIRIDPESLIPKLPKPKDLHPFPTTCYLEFHGHTGPVHTIAVDPSGMWLASGSSDRTVRLWEVQTGRCCRVWNMSEPVKHIVWNPKMGLFILAIAVGKEVVLLDTELSMNKDEVSKLLSVAEESGNSSDGSVVKWGRHETLQALTVTHNQDVSYVSWHYKGDYFASLAPTANTKAVVLHQMTTQKSDSRNFKGIVVSVQFHPSRPFLFVATKAYVYVYNLKTEQRSKKLMSGLNSISSMAIHPKGDNLIVGSEEGKLCWFDMDYNVKAYKTIKNHSEDIQAVAFHTSYPLFASCSDDSTAHVFHGMVYSDLLQNPLIVPLKILHGHKKVNGRGLLACQFHTKQPWLFTAGADSVIRLFSN